MTMTHHKEVRPIFPIQRFILSIVSLSCPAWVASALVVLLGAPALAAAPDEAPAPAPDEEEFVRFTLETARDEGPATPAATPYHTIRYEITRRRPATTAVHRRRLPGLEEGLHALGLLTPEEAAEFFALARSLDAAGLPSRIAATPPPGALTWRCDVLLDGKTGSFAVTDPENARDRRYARLFDATRRTVLAHAGELPFRNVFFPADDRGWLNIESVPAAAVVIDGFETKLETPMYSYDIAAGKHQLTLRSLDGRYDRTFEIRVEPQGTTTLRIDLR
jgi:hypothetical protein